ncbi:MAG: hypothetical protein HRT74_05265 [Flavobacteriales bacterium]|nr:hypothetical protein [Flavobacteriales bacterium]
MNHKPIESEVILLSDYRSDRSSVQKLLDTLEALDIIRYSVQQKRTLSFFAEERTPPHIIVMFMDHQETIGIHFSQNFFLLQLMEFGAIRYFFLANYPVQTVDGERGDFLEMVVNMAIQADVPQFCFN